LSIARRTRSAPRPVRLCRRDEQRQALAEQVVPLRLREDEVNEGAMVHGVEVAPDVLRRDPPRPGPAAHRWAGSRIRELPRSREPREAEDDDVLAEGAGRPHRAVARPDQVVALDLEGHVVVVRPLYGPGDGGAVRGEIDNPALVRVVAPAAVLPVAGTKAQGHGRDVLPEAAHGAGRSASGIQMPVSRPIMVARTRWPDPTAGPACP
jgi:hypothetical protein